MKLGIKRLSPTPVPRVIYIYTMVSGPLWNFKSYWSFISKRSTIKNILVDLPFFFKKTKKRGFYYGTRYETGLPPHRYHVSFPV